MSLVAAQGEDTSRLRLRRALRRAPLFTDLDAESMAAIERELTLLVLPGGAPLFRQIEESGADLVVTDCETCKWQIEMSTSKRCEHPMTLLIAGSGSETR